jgi:MFS family permease
MNHRFLHYSMAFLMSMFVGIGGLAWPLLATQIGSSDLELGIIGSAAAGFYALVVVSAGTLSDRLGRKRVIVTGAIITGIAHLVMPLSRTPMHLILLMLVLGCGMASFWPVLEAWMSEEGSAEELRKELGAFNVSWSAGGAIGPFIAGFLYTQSVIVAFACAGAGALFVGFLASLHKKPGVPLNPVGGGKTNTPAEINTESVSRSTLYAAWIANFASWFTISEIRVLFPKLGLDLGMQPWIIGTVMFCLSLALTIMFYAMGVSGRWHNKIAPLLCAQALLVILLLASTVVDSPLAFGIIFSGLGLGYGVTYSYSLYCSVVGSLNKGAASGRHEMVLGTGALLGPLIGGAAAHFLHAPRAPYLLAAGMVMAAIIAEAIVFLLLRAREERDFGA